jgi:hypothetical protein
MDRAGRFLTVDRWTDYASWQAFLDRWGSDYRELDQRLSGLADGGEMIAEGFAEGF